MGVGHHEILLLRLAHRASGPFGRTLMVGRQNFFGNVSAQLKTLGYNRKPGEVYIEDFLRECFGSSSVDSIDASQYEGATIIHDLNQEFPLTDSTRQFDTILDFGTIEHVFNIANALQAIRNMLAPGGQVLHSSPTNGLSGHGFWQVSPIVWTEFYHPTNGYETCEVYVHQTYGIGSRSIWWRLDNTRSRVFVLSGHVTLTTAIARKSTDAAGGIPSQLPSQPDYEDLWADAGTDPRVGTKMRVFINRFPQLKSAAVSVIDVFLSPSSGLRAAVIATLGWLLPMRLSPHLKRLRIQKVLNNSCTD